MKWIYRFFVVLGVIFFFILIGIGYFIVADPLNIRPMVMSLYNADNEMNTDGANNSNSSEGTVRTETGTNSGVLNDQQEAALTAVGINPELVPSQFTPEQIECFVGVLGQERVDDIKAGDTPTASEYYQAKDCV